MSSPSTSPTPRVPSLGDFAPLAGEAFTLGAGGVEVPVRLSEVKSLGWNRPAAQGGRESFSLIFHAPAKANVTQGIYEFTHPRLGTETMFLVPLGPDAQGMCLEVIFNFN